MYELNIKDHFSAAHNLREYKGDCEKLHGHNWQVEVVVETEILNSEGLGIDFRLLSKYLKEIISILDHQYLNELEPFKKENPSTENISRFIYEKIKKKLQNIH